MGSLVGIINAEDPQGGQLNLSINENEFFYLEGVSLKSKQLLYFETNQTHEILVSAIGDEFTTIQTTQINVSDVENKTYTGKFFISVFNVFNELLGSKVNYSRYFNPLNKNVGKWNVRKTISGGADANKFEIKGGNDQKNVDGDSEGFLAFINPPDFENPGDADGDNIYEVNITYLNLEDGSEKTPIPVTQRNIFVPENAVTAIELQSLATGPLEDTDGDGVVDVEDNSPLVSNPNQVDEDGDGVWRVCAPKEFMAQRAC